MTRQKRLKLAGGAAAIVAALGAGGAIAADRLAPTAESDAIVSDAAKQLGIPADKLDAALKQALANRIDAAVEAGTVTEEQGAALKARIAAGEVPLAGIGPGPGHHHGGPRGGHLDAAASYLVLTEDELRTRLEAGDTLAGVAQAEGKSVDGLVAALVAAAQERLDEAVADGRLTEAQRTELLTELETRIEAAVDGEAGFGFRHPGRPGGHGAGFEAPATLPPAA